MARDDGGERLAVLAHRHAPHPLAAGRAGSDWLVRGDVPALDDAVVAAADQLLAVAAEGQGVDLTPVPLELADLLAGLGVPVAQLAVAAGRDEALAVRREGDGRHLGALRRPR